MIISGILFAVIGLLLIFAFIMSVVKCKNPVTATVSKITEKSITVRTRKIKEYTPVFTYTVDGKTYSAKADSSTRDPDKFTPGQNVMIFVDPKEPAKIRYGSNFGYFLVGCLFLAIGVLFIVLSIL